MQHAVKYDEKGCNSTCAGKTFDDAALSEIVNMILNHGPLVIVNFNAEEHLIMLCIMPCHASYHVITDMPVRANNTSCLPFPNLHSWVEIYHWVMLCLHNLYTFSWCFSPAVLLFSLFSWHKTPSLECDAHMAFWLLTSFLLCCCLVVLFTWTCTYWHRHSVWNTLYSQ